jgi:flagellar motor switch protein FliG
MGNMLRRGINAYQQTMSDDSAMPPIGGTPPTGGTPLGGTPPGGKPPAGKKNAETARAEGLLKTNAPAVNESKIRRVAKFFILIGSEQAAKILNEFDAKQVEEISREIALIRGISPQEADAVLAEFMPILARASGLGGMSSGGVESARRILYTAYGPEKGEKLLNRNIPNSKENIFDFLEEFSPEQIVFLLKDESPAAAALVLARLSPKVTAQTLAKFPPALKPEILKRIARQNEIAPEVLESVAGALRERARHLGSSDLRDIPIDGMKTLAAILKQGDYAFGDKIVGELETENPDVGKVLKDSLYTLDDVLAVFDRPLAEKLRTMPDRDIAVLLIGRSDKFCEKILSNISAGRREIIREEREMLGGTSAVSKREYNEVAKDFLAWFRLAREKGSLIMTTDEDWVT